MAAAAGVQRSVSAMQGVLDEPPGISNGGSPSQTFHKTVVVHVPHQSVGGSKSVPADKAFGMELADAMMKELSATPEQAPTVLSLLQMHLVTPFRLDAETADGEEPMVVEEAPAAAAAASAESSPIQRPAQKAQITAADIWGPPKPDKADILPRGLNKDDGDSWLHCWTVRHTGSRDPREHQAWLRDEEIRKKAAAEELAAWLKTQQ